MAGVNVMDGPHVIVLWNEATDQPIGNGGYLFNRWLNDLGKNWLWFPIHFQTWKHVLSEPKSRVFEDVVEVNNFI